MSASQPTEVGSNETAPPYWALQPNWRGQLACALSALFRPRSGPRPHLRGSVSSQLPPSSHALLHLPGDRLMGVSKRKGMLAELRLYLMPGQAGTCMAAQAAHRSQLASHHVSWGLSQKGQKSGLPQFPRSCWQAKLSGRLWRLRRRKPDYRLKSRVSPDLGVM